MASPHANLEETSEEFPEIAVNGDDELHAPLMGGVLEAGDATPPSGRKFGRSTHR